MASITEKAKESVKESLVGVEEDPQREEQQASAQTRADFMQHAIRDEATGEYYMGQEQFVNAVAPPGEDYVRITFLL
jgi:solute carrier family 25 aspartate/glutamate transporter 12/13